MQIIVEEKSLGEKFHRLMYFARGRSPCETRASSSSPSSSRDNKTDKIFNGTKLIKNHKKPPTTMNERKLPCKNITRVYEYAIRTGGGRYNYILQVRPRTWVALTYTRARKKNKKNVIRKYNLLALAISYPNYPLSLLLPDAREEVEKKIDTYVPPRTYGKYVTEE